MWQHVLVTPEPGRQKQGHPWGSITSQPLLPAHVCAIAHTLKAGPVEKHSAATAFSHLRGVHIQMGADDTAVPVSTEAEIFFYLLYFKDF